MSDLVLSENIPPLATCITVTCLFTVTQAAPMKRDTSTCSPEDHRYPFNDMCCNMCQPGYKVQKHCTHTPDDGICVPCSEGYFTSEWNGATRCLPINLCNKSHEHINVYARPDGTSNNICACDPGFQYTASGELCIESPVKYSTQGSEATLAPSFTLANSGSTLTSGSTQTKVPSSPTASGSYVSHDHIISALSISLCLIILAAFIIGILFIVCFCCRRKYCCFGQDRENVEENGDETKTQKERKEPDSDSGRFTGTPGTQRATSQEYLQREPSGSNLSESHDQMLSATNSGQEMCMQMHTYKSEEHADEIHEGSGTLFTETGRTVSQENLQRGQPDNQVFNDPDEANEVVDGNEGYGMTYEDMKVLLSLMPAFRTDLPVQQTLDWMYDVFDKEEVEEITLSSKTPHQQRRCLIDTLTRKGPEAFRRFVSVLDKVRPHLADAVRDRKNGKQLGEVLEGLPSLEQ